MIFTIFSVYYLDPSDAITLSNLGLISTAIIGRIIIKEKLTIIHIFSGVLSLIGVVFVLRPEFLFIKNQSLTNSSIFSSRNHKNNEHIQIGVVCAVLGAICFGFSNILTKKLGMNKVHYSVVLFFPCFLGLPISAAVSLILYLLKVSHTNPLEFRGDRFNRMEIFYAFMAALISTLSVIFLNWALDKEEALKVVILKTTGVLITYVLQYFTLDIKVDLLGLMGAFFILLGSFLIVVFRFLNKKYENNSSRVVRILFKKF